MDVDQRGRQRPGAQRRLGQEQGMRQRGWEGPKAGGTGGGMLRRSSGQAIGLIYLGGGRQGQGGNTRDGQLPLRWRLGERTG